MRKLLTGAVVASAALAIAGGAVAQAPDATLDVRASPSKAGTKKKPRNVKLTFNETVNKPGTTVGTIQIRLPKGLEFSGKGFPKCQASALLAKGLNGCKSSKAGPTGSAAAAFPDGTPLDFAVSPFVGDSKTFLFYLSQVGGPIQSVIKGKISNSGRNMDISIPFELRQPVGGLDTTLTAINATFTGKKGKHFIVSSTGCTGKKWSVKGILKFSSRADGAPVPPPATLTDTVTCTK